MHCFKILAEILWEIASTLLVLALVAGGFVAAGFLSGILYALFRLGFKAAL